MTDEIELPALRCLNDRRVALVGRLASMSRREAQQLVRRAGGVPVELSEVEAGLVVVGEDGPPLLERFELADDFVDRLRAAAADGRLEIITETQLWQRLGLVEGEHHVRRLYTPAMLAELLGVPVSLVRRWHRRGLITAVRTVHRLPYFDFQEAAGARRLAEMLAAGVSPQAIERQLAALARFLPEARRSLAQLSLIVEGKRLLVRHGGELVDSLGQRRFDFDAATRPAWGRPRRTAEPPGEARPVRDSDTLEQTAVSAAAAAADPATHPTAAAVGRGTADGGGAGAAPTAAEQGPDDELAMPSNIDEWLELALRLDDEGLLDEAADAYRSLLAAAGPQADVCFYLGELLYRMGDLSAARERFYMAIELDEDYVEARANLGCVLAESGQLELAVAAFTGALAFHDEYADVHFHLARTLDELDRSAEAEPHWRAFLELAPTSPWADEARQRVSPAPSGRGPG